VNEALLRSLTPRVLGILVRRGVGIAAAEDAVQDALVEVVRVRPTDPPRDGKGRLVTVSWRRLLGATRAGAARRRLEDLLDQGRGDLVRARATVVGAGGHFRVSPVLAALEMPWSCVTRSRGLLPTVGRGADADFRGESGMSKK
jgi:predicted RNA polymerase sigma factor